LAALAPFEESTPPLSPVAWPTVSAWELVLIHLILQRRPTPI
jgi:hypothetical protein